MHGSNKSKFNLWVRRGRSLYILGKVSVSSLQFVLTKLTRVRRIVRQARRVASGSKDDATKPCSCLTLRLLINTVDVHDRSKWANGLLFQHCSPDET